MTSDWPPWNFLFLTDFFNVEFVVSEPDFTRQNLYMPPLLVPHKIPYSCFHRTTKPPHHYHPTYTNHHDDAPHIHNKKRPTNIKNNAYTHTQKKHNLSFVPTRPNTVTHTKNKIKKIVCVWGADHPPEPNVVPPQWSEQPHSSYLLSGAAHDPARRDTKRRWIHTGRKRSCSEGEKKK